MKIVGSHNNLTNLDQGVCMKKLLKHLVSRKVFWRKPRSHKKVGFGLSFWQESAEFACGHKGYSVG